MDHPGTDWDTPGSARAARTRWRALAEDPEVRALAERFAAARHDVRASRSSLERLLALCRPVAEQIARVYGHSEADAADMAQEALIAIARFLPDLRDPGAFPHWLAAVVHNACRQWLRRERRHRSHPLGTSDDAGDLREDASWLSADSQALDAVEARDILYRLLRTLPPRERELVSRAYLDERPRREIVRRMDVSDKAVESLLYRALRRLRTVATQCAPEWESLALWCPECGGHPLQARLEPGNGPRWPLRVRAVCPACSDSSFDIGLPLGHYASLEAALVDAMAAMGEELLEVVRASVPACGDCGVALVLRQESVGPGRWAWRCPRCRAAGAAGIACVAATLPAWRALWLGSPRLRFAPPVELRRAGETRLALTAWDAASGREATLELARDTLAVRALEVGSR